MKDDLTLYDELFSDEIRKAGIEYRTTEFYARSHYQKQNFGPVFRAVLDSRLEDMSHFKIDTVYPSVDFMGDLKYIYTCPVCGARVKREIIDRESVIWNECPCCNTLLKWKIVNTIMDREVINYGLHRRWWDITLDGKGIIIDEKLYDKINEKRWNAVHGTL